MERFHGLISLVEGDSSPADLIVEHGTLRLVISDKEIGSWEVEDVSADQLDEETVRVEAGSERFKFVSVDAERLVELIDPPTEFAEHVESLAFRGLGTAFEPAESEPEEEPSGPVRAVLFGLALVLVVIAIWVIAATP